MSETKAAASQDHIVRLFLRDQPLINCLLDGSVTGLLLSGLELFDGDAQSIRQGFLTGARGSWEIRTAPVMETARAKGWKVLLALAFEVKLKAITPAATATISPAMRSVPIHLNHLFIENLLYIFVRCISVPGRPRPVCLQANLSNKLFRKYEDVIWIGFRMGLLVERCADTAAVS
jgi:hypothetical protein